MDKEQKRRGDMNRLALFIASVLLPLWSLSAFAGTEVLNLRHWAAPDHTRLVFDTDNEFKFNVKKSHRTVSVMIEDAAPSKTLSGSIIINKPGIEKVILTPLKSGDLKIEIFLDKNWDTDVFKLKKFEDKPNRLVVDILFPEVEKEESREREKVKVVKKDRIVVIDPGHGGDDPGAIGKKGTDEKDVVLDIGRKLKDVLNAGKGVKAFLTREGDYYVPFKKRLSIARELGADLFISVHADAARNRTASGSSVYCLSMRGATNEAAKILARKENMADAVGGVIGDGANSEESDPIILDMFQNNTINKSKIFGVAVLNSLRRINDIKFSRVQEAPFRVLKLPDIPAILIETAYISNLREERNLKDAKFQMKVAGTIAASAREFLHLPAAVEQVKKKSVVKQDDEGERKTVKLKGVKRSKTRPAPTYKVKKGDTLAKIAERYKTNIAALLKLNHMKLDDPLYVDREIKLPPREADKRAE